tara:strand:- start:26 stop:322 length:297 start_codon:yes stop_codon:yes gene_type:complete
MSQYKDYSSPCVKGNPQAYASLGGYNNEANSQMNLPVSDRVKSNSGFYMVPSFGESGGYAALTHGQMQGNGTGYFNISKAYSLKNGTCGQQYVRKLCQ